MGKKYAGRNPIEAVFDPAAGAREEYQNKDVNAQKARDAEFLKKEAASKAAASAASADTEVAKKAGMSGGLTTGRASRKKRARASLLPGANSGLSDTLG